MHGIYYFCWLFHQFAITSDNWQSSDSFSLALCMLLRKRVHVRVRVYLGARLCVYVPDRRHYTVLTGDEDFDNFRKKPFSDKHHHQIYVRSKFIHFIDFRGAGAAAIFLIASSAKKMRWWNVYAVRVSMRVRLSLWKSMLEHTFSHRSYLVSQPVNDVKKSI